MKPIKTQAAQARFIGFCLLLFGTAACAPSTSDESTYTLVRADKAVTIQATGTLVSKNSAYLVVPQIPRMWNFRIDFLAPEGQLVKEGDSVIRFNSQELNRRLQDERMGLQGKETELTSYQLRAKERRESLALQVAEKRAQAKKLEYKLMVPEHLVERAELEKDRIRAQKAVLALQRIETEQRNLASEIKKRTTNLERGISKNKETINQMEQHLALLNVRATRDGMVVHKKNWRGKRWQVGDEAYPGATIAEIPDLTAMEVKAVVDEVDAGRVAMEQKVDVRLDAYPDQSFRAKVDRMGQIFRTKAYNKPSIVFDAVVSLLETDPELMRPGMATTIKLHVENLTDVLFVPRDCVAFRDGQAFVQQPDGWRGIAETPIQLGRRGDDWFEIVAGIEAGVTILRQHHDEEAAP
ncbi:efflux RND transporter periplasmic adaptor subunit [Acanthopleuribacter pedis]|uniref:HlyD family efflux transporter periplasmic adaptor subunit n=1 Tax=Acanthopleuribacter pedis TaxID=442870 RepID=A0A8J7QCA4_9BACT|nr:HlyD family efflux transporter periplasmic adaptor subunit [Acanthopleuribacter pedis]MBO1321045.1 HlyD family efflux transporter periplasmic adaptor subunit [Acanthopleuribacter pedis]